MPSRLVGALKEGAGDVLDGLVVFMITQFVIFDRLQRYPRGGEVGAEASDLWLNRFGDGFSFWATSALHKVALPRAATFRVGA